MLDKITIWIPVFRPYDKDYKISTDGRIKNKKGIVLKPTICKFGYHRIRLSNNGKSKAFSVNKLTAKHFICRRDDLEVNHDDRDKSNNHVYNFTFMTRSENQLHWRNDERRKN